MWTVVGIWRGGRYFEHFGVRAMQKYSRRQGDRSLEHRYPNHSKDQLSVADTMAVYPATSELRFNPTNLEQFV